MAKTCNKCENKFSRNEETINTPADIVAFIYERTVKKLWIALIVALAIIFASNAIWLWAWMQYDYTGYNVQADGNSNANYIGQDGDIYNGGSDMGTEENTEK